MAQRLDTDGKAQAILYAAVHGDEAACRRFKVSARSLRNYRADAREKGSELSETFRRYAEAVSPEQRAAGFTDWLLGQVKRASELLYAKAEKEANARNPEALRAINDHVATLLEHKTALDYLAGLFGSGADQDALQADTEAGGEA